MLNGHGVCVGYKLVPVPIDVVLVGLTAELLLTLGLRLLQVIRRADALAIIGD